MSRMEALKRACAKVVTNLSAKGCVGVVVVVPPDNGFALESKNANELRLVSRRYVAAVFPKSLDSTVDVLRHDNPAMESSSRFELKIFSPKELGWDGFAQHNIHSIAATTLPLLGASFFATAYFCFKSVAEEEEESTWRHITYESHLIWQGLRTSLMDDVLQSENESAADIKVDSALLHMLCLSQNGFTSQEVGDMIGISRRVVEKRMERFQSEISGRNKLDAIQKAYILRII